MGNGEITQIHVPVGVQGVAFGGVRFKLIVAENVVAVGSYRVHHSPAFGEGQFLLRPGLRLLHDGSQAVHRFRNGKPGRFIRHQNFIQPEIIDHIPGGRKPMGAHHGDFRSRGHITGEGHLPASVGACDSTYKLQGFVRIIGNPHLFQPIKMLVIGIIHPLWNGIAGDSAQDAGPIGQQDVPVLPRQGGNTLRQGADFIGKRRSH